MRTSFPIAMFAASVLLTGLTAQAQNPGPAQGQRGRPVQAQAARSSSGGVRVAVVDINYIFKNHERFKRTMNDIKSDIEQFEGQLREERNKITAKTEQLQGMSGGSPEYDQLETELANLHTQLKLKTGRKRNQILEREAKVYYNAYKEIEDVVASFAERNGIHMVLRYNSQEMDPTKRESVLQGVNRSIVFQRNLNITRLILEELNRDTPPENARNTRPQIPRR